MNYKVIFNALIVILILHLLIKNINFHEILDFSNKNMITEKYENSNNQVNKGNPGNSPLVDNLVNNFVKENTDNYQKELLDYAKSIKYGSNSDILPMNYYDSNENTPNFESNVADLSKFYKNNFENLEKEDSAQLNTSNKLVNEYECLDRQTNSSNNQEDYWKYKNELPMNGGDIDGIVGYDSLDGQYGLYDDNPNASGASCNSDTLDININSNDLRKPDIVN
jgi:hypothetical protein